jgi:hypothetical protein
MHMLIILEDQIRESSEVDKFVLASIPDPVTHPKLHAAVLQHMVHGPCGEKCLKLDELTNTMHCSKKFPKAYQESSVLDTGGFPLYARPANGIKVQVRNRVVDSAWVVPYNPYLLLRYQCHINVEVCSSVKCFKYIYKYCYKGHDRAEVSIEPVPLRSAAAAAAAASAAADAPPAAAAAAAAAVAPPAAAAGSAAAVASPAAAASFQVDEIKQFTYTRYVSAPEAAHRIMKNPMQEMSHTIVRLPVHTPDEQRVVYHSADGNGQVPAAAAAALHRAGVTMLTAFFDLCGRLPDEGALYYQDVPTKCVWDAEAKAWKKRRKNGNCLIGRLYSVSPKDVERYAVRMLLISVPSPVSFEGLRSHEGITYDTFYEAAKARELMDNNEEPRRCMEEAVRTAYSSCVRELFANLLLFGFVEGPADLWTEFAFKMGEDFVYNCPASFSSPFDNSCDVMLCVYRAIDILLAKERRSLESFNIPLPPSLLSSDAVDAVLSMREAPHALLLPGNGPSHHAPPPLPVVDPDPQAMYSSLNSEQKVAVDGIMSAPPGSAYFIDGPAGTGKTYVYTTIFYMKKVAGVKCSSMAWSGIAASLLPGGATVHRTMSLPIVIDAHTTLQINNVGDRADEIRSTDIFFWDEAPMAPRFALEAINRGLQSLMGNDQLFGGKIIVCGGDFRQTLPVVVKGSKSAQIAACLKASALWDEFIQYKLTKKRACKRW